jgi:hypothetical protein
VTDRRAYLTEKKRMNNGDVRTKMASKIERRTDPYISTLRCSIEAMGGSLAIVARFPSGEAVILGFAPPENVFPSEMDVAVAIGDRESTPV